MPLEIIETENESAARPDGGPMERAFARLLDDEELQGRRLSDESWRRRVGPAFSPEEAVRLAGEIVVSRPTQGILAGRRYIILARQSSTREGSTSVADQIKYLRKHGDEAGGACVGILKLPDTRGSLPGLRQDFDLLRQRKLERDDFDSILVYVPDRWTRAGLLHGFGEEYLLRRVAVRVFFGDENRICDDNTDAWGETKRALQYISAQEWARRHAHGVASSLRTSVIEGRRATRPSTPFGCDRLVRSADGVKLYRLRKLPDGRVQKRSADGKRLIDTYERGAVPAKKRTHRVEFVPGDEAEQRAVRRLYELRHREGKGPREIARELNHEGHLSFKGEPWTEWRAAALLDSTIYTGWTYAFVGTDSAYVEQHLGGVETAVYDKDELFTRRRPKKRLSHPAGWLAQEHPEMADFLEGDIREAADEAQKARRFTSFENSRTPPTRRPGGGSKHRGSRYLLSGLLVTREGLVMTGFSCGPSAYPRRAYRVKRSCREVEKRHRLRKQLAAEPLEAAVCQALRGALAAYAPDLEQRLAALLKRELEETEVTAAQIGKLKQERKELREKNEFLAASLSPANLTEVEGLIDRRAREAARLEKEIGRLKQELGQRHFDPEEVAADMVAQLQDLSGGWPNLPPALAKRAAAALINKAEVDLDSKAVTFDLALPDWKPVEKPKEGKKPKKEPRRLLIEPPEPSSSPSRSGLPQEASLAGAEPPSAAPAAGSRGPLLGLVTPFSIRGREDNPALRDRVSAALGRRRPLIARVHCRYRVGRHGRPTTYRCRCARPQLGRGGTTKWTAAQPPAGERSPRRVLGVGGIATA
jgi:hypothetical protein